MRVRWAEHAGLMEEMEENAVLVGKPEGKKTFGRSQNFSFCSSSMSLQSLWALAAFSIP
jgi:hypothetical protein